MKMVLEFLYLDCLFGSLALALMIEKMGVETIREAIQRLLNK